MKRIIYGALITLFTLLSITLLLLYNGYIWFNNPSLQEYPIRGIDISNHQGKIDWKAMKQEKIEFVYIKATEGKDYRDGFFKDNWESAKENNILRGAYHFFTFRSTGQEQAKNFIEIVPAEKACLPPVIDLEFGGNSKDILDRDKLCKELDEFVKVIKETYKQEPVIYTTHEAYDKYIDGKYLENPIWIRDIVKFPQIKKNREWIFWQYSNRGRINGISGFVDMNVFKMDRQSLENLLSR